MGLCRLDVGCENTNAKTKCYHEIIQISGIMHISAAPVKRRYV